MPNEPSVLVLETDDAIRQLLEIVLRRDGYKPLFVRDGPSAVQLASEREFVLFIVDITLAQSMLEPGSRRGVGFIHFLQRQRPELLQRAIVLTGLARRDLPRDLPSVCRVLRKPFDLDDFRAAMSRCAQGNLSVSAVPSG
jgi:CheY-like chemotaxis protein